MAPEDAVPRSPTTLHRFFSNPVVGVVGCVASIIGVALTIFFYEQSRISPDLTCYVNPTKTAIVRKTGSSDLSVSFKGKRIDSDISAMQFALWNRGRQVIRKDHILKPFTLILGSETPILEAVVSKISRDVVGLRLDTSNIAKGVLGVGWDIMENNDGGVIQIVYAGPPEIPMAVTCVLEGQAVPHWRQSYPPKSGWQGIFALCLGLLTLGFFLLMMTIQKRPFDKAAWMTTASMVLLMAMGLWILSVSDIEPPFPF